MKETKAILNRLIKGGIDCYINDKLSAVFELKQMQELGVYDGKSIKESATMSVEKAYIGVTKNAANFTYKDDFVTQFNKALSDMKAEGVIEKIINE